MTNKPMLSVERDLLDRIVRPQLKPRDETVRRRAITELRALLDNPAPELKPFAWYRVPKDFPLQGAFFQYIEGQSERDIQNSLDADFGFYVTRLYADPAAQHQGEPVGEVVHVSEDRIQIGLYDEYSLEVGDLVYAEQPAPVAVAMPDRDELIEMLRHFASCANVAQVGTGAMDFVARLNADGTVHESDAWCRGSIALGNGCGKCSRCAEEAIARQS